MKAYLFAYDTVIFGVSTTLIRATSQKEAIDLFNKAYPSTKFIAITLLED